MAEKRPLTFAGDESGDVSFTFDKGASRYFVVAFIGATQPDELRNALVKLRMARNLPAGYEFKFHRLSSRRLRTALWAALRPLDFQVWALVVDKRRLPDTIRVMLPCTFYVFFVGEAIKLIPEPQRDGTILWLDEFDRSGRTLFELKRTLNVRSIRYRFKSIKPVRSRSEDLVQVADLVAGAIHRRFSKGASDSYHELEAKIVALREY